MYPTVLPCASLETAPLILWQRAWGGDESSLDSLLGMFLIPQAVTSVRVGLTAQALFIQMGPLRVLRGGSCQVWLDGKGDRVER